MSLHSPKDQPDKPHCNPLDYPATLRDLLATETRILDAINKAHGLPPRDQARLDAITAKSTALAQAAKALSELANTPPQ